MTCKEALISNPKLDSESNNKWFKRVSKLTGLHHKSLNKYFYSHREFVEVKRSYDKNGNVVSRTEKLQQQQFLDPKDYGLDVVGLTTNIAHGTQWVKTSKESQNKVLFKLNKDLIKQTLKECNLKPLNLPKITPTSNKVLRVVYTDLHIAMHIENDLYGNGVWNEKLLFETLEIMVSEIKYKFDGHCKIVIDDYGDFMDGFDAMTTRRNHKIPQNMSNVEAYNVGVKFKVTLAKELAELGVPLEFHNVVNSNHGGDFEHIVNIGAKETLKYLLPNVEYNIYPQFISHYFINDWCFLLSHGKEKEFMKFGFKAQLNDKAKDHIISYIDTHKLHNYKVVFCKGDSHQHIQDASNPKFEYNSYMALSPSSEWVSVNFAKGRRGFTIEEINGKRKTSTPIWL